MPGGLRQRITIARAYIGDPPILLMDEPSSNLDREGEADLCATLVELAKDHSIIVVTHSSAILAASDQVLVMQKGRVVRAGRPQDVLPQLVTAQAAQQAQPRQKPQELAKKPTAGASSRKGRAIAGAALAMTPAGSTVSFGETRCPRCGRWPGSS